MAARAWLRPVEYLVDISHWTCVMIPAIGCLVIQKRFHARRIHDRKTRQNPGQSPQILILSGILPVINDPQTGLISGFFRGRPGRPGDNRRCVRSSNPRVNSAGPSGRPLLRTPPDRAQLGFPFSFRQKLTPCRLVPVLPPSRSFQAFVRVGPPAMRRRAPICGPDHEQITALCAFVFHHFS